MGRSGARVQIIEFRLSRIEGVMGTKGCLRHAAPQSPPIFGFWLHNYEFLILVPGATCQVRGEEKPKRKEHLDGSRRCTETEQPERLQG